jgi:LysR family transcriptional regulator, glycine cleavage system transcriptional activator
MPPLAAVRAFETLGRTGSVKGAAEELGVSSGAITQHVHVLEQFLKRRLVQRCGRGIELTVWGKLYLPRLRLGFEQLHKAQEDLEQGFRSDHLVISTYPSLATKWLGPLMFAWKKRYPDASAMISGVHPEPRLDEGEADFRVSYGNRHRHHARYTHLFTDHLVVVASPSLLARVGPVSSARELLKWPLLWVDWGKEYLALPSWHDWFASAGVGAVDDLHRDLLFSFPGAAVDAAIESQGFALVQYSLVASALALGTLIHVLPPELPLPESHFLAWSSAALDKPLGAAFHAWIIGESRRFDCPKLPERKNCD